MAMATPNSLRKKTMAAQALPRRQSVYQGMEGGSSQQLPPPPRVRPMDKSKVESLMKRRYSTRGMPAPVLTNEPFPAELSSKTKAYDVERKNSQPSQFQFDPAPLRNRGFNPEEYIASSLAGASEQEIEQFYENLKNLKSTTSQDLQSNVFNNYESFVSLSHEITDLTNDLSSLSSLLVQFSNLTQSLSASLQKEETNTDTPQYQRERRGAQHHRNSIADLAQIHAIHLQELWHQVEGSQKFLPAQPGRHIIKESMNWTELNSATWKSMKSVHLILLNDHLLVAAKKRGKTSTEPRRAVADRCWNLADIEVNEIMGDKPGTPGVLQITRGREVAVYSAGEGRDSERTSFMQAIKRAAIDLHNKRKQGEGSYSRGGQSSFLIPTSDRNAKGNDAFLRRISASFTLARPDSTSISDTGSMRAAQDRMDEIDVQIALKEFENAATSIDKGRQLLASMDPKSQIYPIFSLHLEERTQQLTSELSRSLMLETHLPTSTKRYTRLLIRLGEEGLARSSYLQARTQYIRRKLRAMHQPGAYGTSEVDGLMEAMASLLVRAIKNSWTVYSESFSESRMASSFFAWVKEHVDGFADIFQRQLFGYTEDSPLYQRAKQGVMHVWSGLSSLGLDITFLLDAAISRPMADLPKSQSTTSEKGLGLQGVEQGL